jgi:hypothetical protein
MYAKIVSRLVFLQKNLRGRTMQLNDYNDFVRILLRAGFSYGGGNSDGIYAVVPFDWRKEPEGSDVRWHTGNLDTDPWEWRIRVLDERDDIAYSKVFCKKSGYITKEWYPYFLAVRRKGLDFADEYSSGSISYIAKRIYDVVSEGGEVPLHEIKQLGGFLREEKSRFEGALVELQMKLYITICGIRQKASQDGGGYGWPATVFCTTEKFWGREVFDKAGRIKSDEAEEAIAERILELNPDADSKKMIRFMRG